MTIGGIRPIQFAAGSPHSLAVLRGFGLEPRACCINTGADHRPTRSTLVHASGLLPVDHPNLWPVRSLVRAATVRHYHDSGMGWTEADHAADMATDWARHVRRHPHTV